VFLVPQVAAWHMVPFGALGCLMLVLSVAALPNRIVSPRLIPCLAIFFCIAYILPLLLLLPTLTRSERDIQPYIDTPVRWAMGGYLFLRKKPGDRVGWEPLGYVAS
jgi:hypothetical protein